MTTDELILAYNPFEGDFGEPGDRLLKDRLGIARKSGPCHDCRQTIQPGTKVRMVTGVYDGQLMSFRWCAACCDAMALAFSDDGAAIDARFALRRAAAQGAGGQDAAEADGGINA